MNLHHNWFMRLLYRLRGRDPVAEYYSWLSSYGRVVEGRIIDVRQERGDVVISYRYRIANVDYETSQQLTEAQTSQKQIYVPGASISVRFDPRRPAISIVP
jgi:hypothetical protein